MRTPYEILGVPMGAFPDEIKAAHRRLAKKFHPDINPAPDAGKILAEVNGAYEMLKGKVKQTPYTPPRAPPKDRTVQRTNASGYAAKIYGILSPIQGAITIAYGWPKLPANSCIFLMRNEREYRVVIKEERTLPFTIQVKTPFVTITVVE